MGFESGTNRAWFFCFAVVLRLGFLGLLRPREAVNLRRQDIVIHDDAGNNRVAMLTIHSPKNKEAMGFSQSALMKDETTIL
eukprot:669937-Karenia_brevis.AAC.1